MVKGETEKKELKYSAGSTVFFAAKNLNFTGCAKAKDTYLSASQFGTSGSGHHNFTQYPHALASQLHSNMRLLPRVKIRQVCIFWRFLLDSACPSQTRWETRAKPANGRPPKRTTSLSPWPESYACSNMPAELDPRRCCIHMGFGGLWPAARVSGGATRYARVDVARRWHEGCGNSLEGGEGKLWGSMVVGAVLSWLWTREKTAFRHLHITSTWRLMRGKIVRSTDSLRLLALWARLRRTDELFELV